MMSRDLRRKVSSDLLTYLGKMDNVCKWRNRLQTGILQTGDNWEMVGLLPLFDPPRHDTKETIDECLKKGISVKMVTGGKFLSPFHESTSHCVHDRPCFCLNLAMSCWRRFVVD